MTIGAVYYNIATGEIASSFFFPNEAYIATQPLEEGMGMLPCDPLHEAMRDYRHLRVEAGEIVAKQTCTWQGPTVGIVGQELTFTLVDGPVPATVRVSTERDGIPEVVLQAEDAGVLQLTFVKAQTVCLSLSSATHHAQDCDFTIEEA